MARKRLLASSIEHSSLQGASSLPCRDRELNDLVMHLRRALSDQTGGCICNDDDDDDRETTR